MLTILVRTIIIGELGHQKELLNEENETNDFSLGFINSDPNNDFIDEEDYSSSPSFDVVEEIKVSHGLSVSTRQVAETFFHQLMPSQTVQVHLNPVILFGNNFFIDKETCQHSLKPTGKSVAIDTTPSYLKFKATGKAKLVELRRAIRSLCNLICIAYLLFFQELWLTRKRMTRIVNWKMNMISGKGLTVNVLTKMEWEKKIGIKWGHNGNKLVSGVNIRYGNGVSVFLKKVGVFLTISLALCTMWANHIGA